MAGACFTQQNVLCHDERVGPPSLPDLQDILKVGMVEYPQFIAVKQLAARLRLSPC